MSSKPIIDDAFTRYERLETQDVAVVTEANIGRLAQLLRWSVDFTGDEPVLVKPDGESGFGGRRFKVGDAVDNYGRTASIARWKEAGTWQEVAK